MFLNYLIGYTLALFVFLFVVRRVKLRALAWAQLTPSSLDDMVIPAFAKLGRYVGIITYLVLVLGLIGIDVRGLIGFGGILSAAIAFGAREYIGNWFSFLQVYQDKTFDIGKKIALGDVEGKIVSIRPSSVKVQDEDNGDITTIPIGKVAGSIVRAPGKKRA